MAYMNVSSIMEKVRSFSMSPKGKKIMQQYISQCRTDGYSKTSSGDMIITEQTMIRAAETLISMLKDAAARYQLPNSVREHFNSLDYEQPIPYGKEGGQYKIDISFGDNLRRMSLLITSGKNKGQRTGDGIKNIVSLFDTGYDAGSQVWGTWEGHGDDPVASLTHREGLHFMRETLNAFNQKWGALYGVYAYIPSGDGRFYSSDESF